MTTATTTRVDWVAVDAIATQLGPRTQRLVTARDPTAVYEYSAFLAITHAGVLRPLYQQLAALTAPNEVR